MQTLHTPISQIVSPNATPAPANRALPSAGSADGDFQRTLNRQMEQRQASRNAAHAQASPPRPAPAAAAQPAAAPAAKPPAADSRPAPGERPAAPEAQAKPASEANAAAGKDGSARTDDATEEETAPADPAAHMLALVGSIQLAMQQPATASKSTQEPAARGIKADGKSLAASQLLDASQAGKDSPEADAFADSRAQVRGKGGAAMQAASAPLGGKAEAGKLAIDAQLAASVRSGAPLAEAVLKETPADLARLAAQLQPGALQQAAAAAAVPSDKLTGRVGTPAWDQQLGQKVVWMAAGGDQSATLTLNPPDLGPVQVVLTVTNDQADAAFMSAQPEVRQALEAAMPRLREMMSEAGIAFGNASVSAGTPGQQESGQREASGDARRGGGQGGAVTGGEINIAPSTAGRGRATLGAVDTFA